jgi:hypothetical protein
MPAKLRWGVRHVRYVGLTTKSVFPQFPTRRAFSPNSELELIGRLNRFSARLRAGTFSPLSHQSQPVPSDSVLLDSCDQKLCPTCPNCPAYFRMDSYIRRAPIYGQAGGTGRDIG